MVVPTANLAIVPYNIGPKQVLAPVPAVRGEHKMYATANARIDDAWNANPAIPVLQDFAPTLNPAGNTIYLPYEDDHITSVRLPDPPPAGVDFFLTANMSGCKFYIDTITGSTDLMVYHANTHQHGSPPHGAPVNFQTLQASHILTALHTNAQGDYAALAPPNNLALVNIGTLEKARYYQEGANAEQRKANQGRGFALPGGGWGTPEFAGGCSVMGFYNGGWTFRYQAWGGVDYVRPSGKKAIAKDLFTGRWQSLHNRRTLGVQHSAFADITVVDSGLI